MRPKVNVATCEPDEAETEIRGEFAYRALTVTETLGAQWSGATVFDVPPGCRRGPYHFHYGVEEWMYVIDGAPTHRDRAGERVLAPGQLVAFASGPAGAHTVAGPGRVIIFSAGATGWGEAFVTVYEDSDAVAAAPGVKFRRADAIEAWAAPPGPGLTAPPPAPDGCPVLDLGSVEPDAVLAPRLGARTWEAELLDLDPGSADRPFVYEWCREGWALVLAGTPSLRHPGGREELEPGDLVCFPQGPGGARGWANAVGALARLLLITTPAGRPYSRFHPDDDTVVIEVPGVGGARFRLADQITDYYDGEPGAGPVPAR